MAAIIQTQKALDRMQQVFVDLPRIVSDIAKSDNLTTDEAIEAFVDKVRNNVHTIANAKHSDLSGALDSVRALEDEVNFVKGIYRTDSKKIAQFNELVDERAKNLETIQSLREDLTLMQSQMNQCQNETPHMERQISDYVVRINKAEQNLKKVMQQYQRSESTIKTLTNNLTSVTAQSANDLKIQQNILSKFRTMLTNIYPNDSRGVENLNDVYAKFEKLITYLNTMGVTTDNIIANTRNFQNDELASARTKIAAMQVSASQREAEMRKMTTQLTNLQTEVQNVTQNANAEIENYKTQIQQLTRVNAELKDANAHDINALSQEDEAVLNAANERYIAAQRQLQENEQTIERLSHGILTVKAEQALQLEPLNNQIAQLNSEIDMSKNQIKQLTSDILDLDMTRTIMQSKLTALKTLFESYNKRLGTTSELEAISELIKLIDDQTPNVVENFKMLTEQLATNDKFNKSDLQLTHNTDYDDGTRSNFDSNYCVKTPGRSIIDEYETQVEDNDTTLTENSFQNDDDNHTSNDRNFTDTMTITASETDGSRRVTATRTLSTTSSNGGDEAFEDANSEILNEPTFENTYLRNLEVEAVTDVSMSSTQQQTLRTSFANVLNDPTLVNALTIQAATSQNVMPPPSQLVPTDSSTSQRPATRTPTKRPLSDSSNNDTSVSQTKRQNIVESADDNAIVISSDSDASSIKSTDTIFNKRSSKKYNYKARIKTTTSTEETRQSLLSNTDTEDMH